MSEAKNMTLKAKLMLNEKNTRLDGGSRPYGAERVDRGGTSRVVAEIEKEMVWY